MCSAHGLRETKNMLKRSTCYVKNLHHYGDKKERRRASSDTTPIMQINMVLPSAYTSSIGRSRMLLRLR